MSKKKISNGQHTRRRTAKNLLNIVVPSSRSMWGGTKKRALSAATEKAVSGDVLAGKTAFFNSVIICMLRTGVVELFIPPVEYGIGG